MERKNYLELCQKVAVGYDGIFVEYGGIKYIPVSLVLWFNGKGEGQNTAVLQDPNSKSVMNCRLQDVSYLDKQS